MEHDEKKSHRVKRKGLFTQISDNWKALAAIGVIFGTGIGGWNYTMAQVDDRVQVQVDAKVNKAMIDGAKQAAADAVKEQLPAISKQVAKDAAKEAIQELLKQQAEEKAKKGK